jgi:hypothetical protein
MYIEVQQKLTNNTNLPWRNYEQSPLGQVPGTGAPSWQD